MSSPTTIPLTQRAAVLEGFNQPYIIRNDYPVTQPSELRPNECLVRLEFTGVCHSDLHVKQGDWARKANLPLIGGHEGVGRIVAIGEHSSRTQVGIGARVGIKWIGTVCRACEMCRKGHESSCELSFGSAHGYMKQGTFQEYVVSYLDYVTPVPDELDSASAAPILCAGLTVYKALKQANLSIGQWVAISGAGGGLGHLGIQYAVSMGLRVLAIDTGEEKRLASLKLGAEKWIDFRESGDNLVQDVKDATGGLGPNGAIIAAGVALPFNQALMYLRRTGVLVAVGMPGGNAALSVPITLLISKSLTILGSAIGSQQDATEALLIASLGKVKAQYVVRELEDLNDVFDDMASGKVTGRVVLRLTAR